MQTEIFAKYVFSYHSLKYVLTVATKISETRLYRITVEKFNVPNPYCDQRKKKKSKVQYWFTVAYLHLLYCELLPFIHSQASLLFLMTV